MSCELIAKLSFINIPATRKFETLIATAEYAKVVVGPTGPQGTQGNPGVQGPQGEPGESYLNIDGGNAFSIYGGVPVIDGGNAFN